jgi:TPR repeat protein
MEERIIAPKNKTQEREVYAQIYLGYIYKAGREVTKQLRESARWYCMAAKSGNQYEIKALKGLGSSKNSLKEQ